MLEAHRVYGSLTAATVAVCGIFRADTFYLVKAIVEEEQTDGLQVQ